ncbi:MAG: sulfotransferase [Gemmatimonadetes bacterium]|nr:sulfotransferase [Gemmatimonadota bacterium]
MKTDFNQTRLMRFFGWLVHAHPNFWIDVGKLETQVLKSRLARRAVDAPIYITGLARAGTTLLLNILASHPRLTSFKYCDYYGAFTPFWADHIFRAVGLGAARKQERAHADGVMVNAYSPEAMEEILWMQFFAYLHDPAENNVVERQTSHPEFEAVYAATLAKLLLCRDAERIVSKNNYNITRIAYLAKLYEDARFVIAVRHPVAHIASMARQHQRNLAHFSSPIHRQYLRNAGHFEFGHERIPITIDAEKTRHIQTLWGEGRYAEGWAEYWNAIYAWTYEELLQHEALETRCLVVSFEHLCAAAEQKITDILAFCNLDADEAWVKGWAEQVAYQPQYEAVFSVAERDTIMQICGATAKNYGL